MLAPIRIRGDPDLPDAAGRMAECRGGGAGFPGRRAGVPGQGAARGKAEQQLDVAARGIRAGGAGLRGTDSERRLPVSARTCGELQKRLAALRSEEQPGAGAAEDRIAGSARFLPGDRVLAIDAGGSGQPAAGGFQAADRSAEIAAAAHGGGPDRPGAGTGGGPAAGEVKMFVTDRALEFRRGQSRSVRERRVLPLEVKGSCAAACCGVRAETGPAMGGRGGAAMDQPGPRTGAIPRSDCRTERRRNGPMRSRAWSRAWRVKELLAEFPVGMWTSEA